ncbi:ATPase subunit of ABC transporter with duplicated ATPase domains [Geomicrobium halophilum]|uniref:ATPase subunit of ABC transporter with duplicated ATPase domains n=1 Tax=Geomicrobium halophilum TaxID=549000 RepID=A0A841Q0C4_9BACL|nr:ABC-F type ribosomal protection protein [Geomicrobium halophilum]MBB6451063.1 ATPase subunit of ABC transporter with duplicated ATPase domains [Geomicrobium halophilum]
MKMFIFQATNLAKEWNGNVLFRDVDLELKQGEHVALFGKNGTGKTTLLNGLLGRIAFDEGNIHRLVPLSQWVILDQELESKLTVREFVETGAVERSTLKKELKKIELRMADPEQAMDEAVMEEYSELHDRFLQADGYQLETDVEKCLQEVTLSPDIWDSPVDQLSGGQKTRTQLARILIHHPACLMMDEPTNHLDQETIEWLEEWLQRYEGAVLFVSHDRYFLDRTADAILELGTDGCKRYTGGYTEYKKQKDLEWQTQETLYRKQEQKRQDLLETIRNYQEWYQQAHQSAGKNDFARAKAKKNVSRFKAKERELERLENDQVQKPQKAQRMNMQLGPHSFSARTLLRLEDVSFSYPHFHLFEELNVTVNRGDRIAVIGPNGSGKTTLLKLMIGSLSPSSGAVKMNPQTKVGYFAQELDHLQEEQTILDYFLSIPDVVQSEIRTLLGSFLFSKDAVYKKIGDLSMGEKCRIAFLKLYLSEANLLVLDEPTNFLDIDTREVMEAVLESYSGAFVLVSHDRYLLENMANRIWRLDGVDVEDYQGNYTEYQEYQEQPKLNAEDQGRENELRQLQLELTALITTDMEGEAEEEKEEKLNRIKEVRRQIQKIEGSFE